MKKYNSLEKINIIKTKKKHKNTKSKFKMTEILIKTD